MPDNDQNKRFLNSVPMGTIDPAPPRCLRCGEPLQVTPDRFGQPTIDAMNVAAGLALCQTCLLVEDDFH